MIPNEELKNALHELSPTFDFVGYNKNEQGGHGDSIMDVKLYFKAFTDNFDTVKFKELFTEFNKENENKAMTLSRYISTDNDVFEKGMSHSSWAIHGYGKEWLEPLLTAISRVAERHVVSKTKNKHYEFLIGKSILDVEDVTEWIKSFARGEKKSLSIFLFNDEDFLYEKGDDLRTGLDKAKRLGLLPKDDCSSKTSVDVEVLKELIYKIQVITKTWDSNHGNQSVSNRVEEIDGIINNLLEELKKKL